jgi:hypothetical protein
VTSELTSRLRKRERDDANHAIFVTVHSGTGNEKSEYTFVTGVGFTQRQKYFV